MNQLQKVVNQICDVNILQEIKRGIERECLRVTREGKISQNPHPRNIGAALTHPYITTDYSEALLEFVTPTFNDIDELLSFLKMIHVFVAKNIGDEVLWNNSMPCLISREDTIPIADYGKSNIGRMKKIYRKGLYHRYGSAMQAISGIHFNFSLSNHFFNEYKSILKSDQTLKDFKSSQYMNLSRNIHKHSWIIPYFFGSSPVICKSFLNKVNSNFQLKNFDEVGTLTYEGATSLRLSDLGYTNSNQGEVEISYNDLNEYILGLQRAITTPNEPYEKIGLKDKDQYKQLNCNLLQLENEYYSEVRPKMPTKSGEAPTKALKERGIEYIELRSVDINTFSPIGISKEQVLFLDIFLAFCLLQKSPLLDQKTTQAFRGNQELVARHGRQKNLSLFDGEKEMKATEWAKEVFKEFYIISEYFDKYSSQNVYSKALQKYEDMINNSNNLNSERLINELKDKNESFFKNTLRRSKEYSEVLKNENLSQEDLNLLNKVTNESFSKQKEKESETISFEDFLDNYYKKNKIL